MKLELVTHPNEWLTKKLDPWDWENPPVEDPAQLKKDMLELMFASEGIGLSANQVGINARCFVMVHNQSNYQSQREQLMINPEVVETKGVEVECWEGCLSFPGINVQVKRPSEIIAKWTDEKQVEHQHKFTGYDAVCFQHELDHLNGITFNEHVSPMIWKEAVQLAEAK